jgi:hypothetical protein
MRHPSVPTIFLVLASVISSPLSESVGGFRLDARAAVTVGTDPRQACIA